MSGDLESSERINDPGAPEAACSLWTNGAGVTGTYRPPEGQECDCFWCDTNRHYEQKDRRAWQSESDARPVGRRFTIAMAWSSDDGLPGRPGMACALCGEDTVSTGLNFLLARETPEGRAIYPINELVCAECVERHAPEMIYTRQAVIMFSACAPAPIVLARLVNELNATSEGGTR